MTTTPLVVNRRERDPGDPPDKNISVQEQTFHKEGNTGVSFDKPVTSPTTGMPKVLSFKDKLLQTKEMDVEGPGEEEELVENKWYQYQKEEEELEKRAYVYDPCPEIKVSDSELDKWSEPWKEALVVSLLGKKVNFRMLENKLQRDWARKGTIQITDLAKNFYVVQFSSKEDYKHALLEGPWMLADHYLLVQRWRPFFLTNATVERKVVVWVRFPELPLELYNDRFLWRVGPKLGTLLKIDRLTSIHSRGQFARLCVEIDLSKKLIPSIIVRGVILKLEYEGLHVVCFACGKYGHKQDSCPEMINPTSKEMMNNGGSSGCVVEGENLKENPSKEKNTVQVSDGLYPMVL